MHSMVNRRSSSIHALPISEYEKHSNDWSVSSGARGGRTLTMLPSTDFKSVASAYSAIAPDNEFYPNPSQRQDNDLSRLPQV